MAVQLGSQQTKNIKAEIITRLNNLGFKVLDEADFFIGLIANIAERKIEDRINRPRWRQSYIKRKRTIAYGNANKQLLILIDDAISSFTRAVAENSDGGMVSSSALYLTMKGICPLWPFC